MEPPSGLVRMRFPSASVGLLAGKWSTTVAQFCSFAAVGAGRLGSPRGMGEADDGHRRTRMPCLTQCSPALPPESAAEFFPLATHDENELTQQALHFRRCPTSFPSPSIVSSDDRAPGSL